MFVLDQRLENESILVENKEIFQVRLMNVKEFFWVVLIPNKPNLIELTDISVEERNILLNFASDIGDFIKFKENIEKMLFKTKATEVNSVEHILEIDSMARIETNKILKKYI